MSAYQIVVLIDETATMEDSPDQLDSTFNLDSSEESDITHNFDLEVNSTSGDSASFTFSSDESENYGSSSDEEIWEISDSEDDTNECSSSPVTRTTVKPPNNGHGGDEHFVHCSEVVPSSEVLPLFHWFVNHNAFI